MQRKNDSDKELEFYGIMSKVFRKHKVLPEKELDGMDRNLKAKGVDFKKIDKIIKKFRKEK